MFTGNEGYRITLCVTFTLSITNVAVLTWIFGTMYMHRGVARVRIGGKQSREKIYVQIVHRRVMLPQSQCLCPLEDITEG
jgi:hypothetical protein